MKIEAPNLAACTGIAHGFFTRNGGASSGLYSSLNTGLGSDDAREKVQENRAKIASALGCSADNLVTAYQIHSPTVVTATQSWKPEDAPKADAIVTRTPGLAIGILTADCGPLLFADPDAGVIGAAHAGWRGAFEGIPLATLEAMEALGASRNNIRVTLGPMISGAAYEVGPEFIATFIKRDETYARFFTPSEKAGHHMFDLPAFIDAQLAQTGIHSFENLGLCTYGDAERFFSYRRSTHRGEPDYGRLMSAIALS